jgi:hypothetical protein
MITRVIVNHFVLIGSLIRQKMLSTLFKRSTGKGIKKLITIVLWYNIDHADIHLLTEYIIYTCIERAGIRSIA